VIPLIAVIDPNYVGHESIRDEVGPDYDVVAASGFAEAQQRVAACDVPIVVIPETLEPEPGRIVLDRLAAAGHRFVGLLLVDDAGALPRFGPASGISHVAFRPLRHGEFRRHVDAAAVSRAALLAVRADADVFAHAIDLVAARLSGLAAHEPVPASDVRRTLTLLTAAVRPLETAWVDPAGILLAAAEAARALHPDVAANLQPTFATDPTARRPRCEADARALTEALTGLVANALRHAARPAVTVTLGCEACRDGDRDGWLLFIEDDGGTTPAADANTQLLHATLGSPRLGLPLAATVARRHGGHLTLTAGAVGWRLELWLPERSSP
jgi:hypothetical protein